MKALLFSLFLVILVSGLLMRIEERKFRTKDEMKFSIISLEWPQSNQSAVKFISQLTAEVQKAVLTNLDIDYVFMVGWYPFVMVISLGALRKLKEIQVLSEEIPMKVKMKLVRTCLMICVFSQAIAWGCDLWENAQIEHWLINQRVDNNIQIFKGVVALKFVLTLGGLMFGILSLSMARVQMKRIKKIKDVKLGIIDL